MDKHEIIGDVRGKGLMIGVELVRDRQTKERAIDRARRARAGDVPPRACWCSAPGKNAIRLSPPLVLTKEQADTLLRCSTSR